MIIFCFLYSSSGTVQQNLAWVVPPPPTACNLWWPGTIHPATCSASFRTTCYPPTANLPSNPLPDETQRQITITTTEATTNQKRKQRHLAEADKVRIYIVLYQQRTTSVRVRHNLHHFHIVLKMVITIAVFLKVLSGS